MNSSNLNNPNKKSLISVIVRIFFTIIGTIFITNRGFSQDIWNSTQGPSGCIPFDIAIDKNKWAVILQNDGIYLSLDKGLSWQRKSKGLIINEYFKATLDFGPDGTLFAILNSKLYILKPNFDEWEEASLPIGIENITISPNGTIFVVEASAPFGLYISKDNGKKFNHYSYNVYIEKYIFNGENNNFIIAHTDKSRYNLFKITDDGIISKELYKLNYFENYLIWHPSKKLLIPSGSNGILVFDEFGNYEMSNPHIPHRIFSNQNGNLFISTPHGDYISENLGKNWKPTGNSNNSRFNSFAKIHLDHDLMVIVSNDSDEGFISSKDHGKSWTSHFQMFKTPYINELITCQNNPYMFSIVRGNPNLLRYNIIQGLWVDIKCPITANEMFINTKDQVFIKNNSTVYKSIDYGNSWTKFSINDDSTFLYLYSDGKDFFIAQMELYTYISKNGGIDWILTETPFGLNDIVNFKSHRNGSVFVLTSHNKIIYISYDLGKNWNSIRLNQGILSMDILEDGSIYLQFLSNQNMSGGIYRSLDLLCSYEFVSNEHYLDLILKNQVLYKSDSRNDIRFSLDSGKTWNSLQSGLPINKYFTKLVKGPDDHLYLSAFQDAVYKTIKPINLLINSNDIENNHSINLYLLGDELHIATELNFHEVSIYSLVGRPVIVIPNYIENINITNLPSGCYVLVLRNEENIPYSKKFVKF
ncbi:MAG: T9SS type A sorting domain-containing protein [Saprospiraceae bacterium]|nr:T9SS type A sorting domain-containing protein [Saprospiraceae bacterium]